MPRDDRIMPADSTGWPPTFCRKGETSAMVDIRIPEVTA